MKIPFVKMHGLGNDFVVIDERKLENFECTNDLAKSIADRHFGVGCDQLLILKNPKNKKNQVFMEVWNTDGSMAEMCGNGIRAVAFYLEKKDQCEFPILIETKVGVKEVLKSDWGYRVNMGEPKFLEKMELKILDQEVSIFPVSMGNPHGVIFVASLEDCGCDELGPPLSAHSRFKEGLNVEFVEIGGSYRIKVRVFERGSGWTLACGTGACASAVAAIREKGLASPLEVELPGGKLLIEWNGKDDSPVMMSGPADLVFEGVWEVKI